MRNFSSPPKFLDREMQQITMVSASLQLLFLQLSFSFPRTVPPTNGNIQFSRHTGNFLASASYLQLPSFRFLPSASQLQLLNFSFPLVFLQLSFSFPWTVPPTNGNIQFPRHTGNFLASASQLQLLSFSFPLAFFQLPFAQLSFSFPLAFLQLSFSFPLPSFPVAFLQLSFSFLLASFPLAFFQLAFLQLSFSQLSFSCPLASSP